MAKKAAYRRLGAQQGRADDLLYEIRQFTNMAIGMDEDSVNWSHVADMARVADDLEKIAEYLRTIK